MCINKMPTCVEFSPSPHPPHRSSWAVSSACVCYAEASSRLAPFTGSAVPWDESTIKIHWYLQGSSVICSFLVTFLQCDRNRTGLSHYKHIQYLLLEITSHQNINNFCMEIPFCCWICSLLSFLSYFADCHTENFLTLRFIIYMPETICAVLSPASQYCLFSKAR